MNCEPAKQFELVERMLAARKQLVGAQSDKMDFYTNRCDGLDRQVDAAEKPGRDWIGIDVTQLAISLIKNRLLDTYGRRMKFVSGPEGRDASPRRPGSGHVADVSAPRTPRRGVPTIHSAHESNPAPVGVL